MKTKKQIKDMFALRLKEFQVLAKHYHKTNEGDLGTLYGMQKNIEDICWILEIEPITKFNEF